MKALQRRASDPADKLEPVIVQSMWLTGFGSPPLHTLYLDRPMLGAALMQAIARVNRRFGEKPSGLVVDFLAIADRLTEALAEYTRSDQATRPIGEDVAKAVEIVQEQHGKLCAMLHGVPWKQRRDSGRPRAFLNAVVDVKRLLKRHGHPPDAEPIAIERVLRQAEPFADA